MIPSLPRRSGTSSSDPWRNGASGPDAGCTPDRTPRYRFPGPPDQKHMAQRPKQMS